MKPSEAHAPSGSDCQALILDQLPTEKRYEPLAHTKAAIDCEDLQ